MNAFHFGDPNLFVKGIAEVKITDAKGNIIGYDTVASEGSVTSSVNLGEITGAVGNPLLITIPDTTRLSGTLTSQAFSLRQRAMISGGTVKNNGVVEVVESGVAPVSGKLTIPHLADYPPARAYTQDSDDTYGLCYVRPAGATDYTGENVGIDLTTGVVQGNYTGASYDIFYFTSVASAKVLDLPSNFTPQVAGLTYKYNVYAKQGEAVTNGSLAGYLYLVVKYAQFTGDAGISASQTANATTAYDWQALANVDNIPDATDFRDCANSSAPYAYYVYVPCGKVTDQVEGLFVVGGGVTAKVGAKVQIPVKYLLRDGTVAQPVYSSLTYASAAAGTAKVDNNGVVEGVAAGNTTVTITVPDVTPAVKATCTVTVTA